VTPNRPTHELGRCKKCLRRNSGEWTPYGQHVCVHIYVHPPSPVHIGFASLVQAREDASIARHVSVFFPNIAVLEQADKKVGEVDILSFDIGSLSCALSIPIDARGRRPLASSIGEFSSGTVFGTGSTRDMDNGRVLIAKHGPATTTRRTIAAYRRYVAWVVCGYRKVDSRVAQSKASQ
jgi:hypothetical protein